MDIDLLYRDGIVRPEYLVGRLPDEARRKRGAYAVIECFEEIPCDPCVRNCRFDAIQPFTDINDLPFVVFENCNACAVCASVCPGLAIFIVDESREGPWGTLRLPYEYLPLPEKGDLVMALGRAGEEQGQARVVAVRRGPRLGTPLVTLEVKKELLQTVRGLRPLRDEEKKEPSATDAAVTLPEDIPEDDAIVCRCEGVTMGEIRQAIRAGAHSLDEVKHRTRSGMGPCQGRTCRSLILGEIARETGLRLADLDGGSYRPPARPVALGLLAEGGTDHAENS